MHFAVQTKEEKVQLEEMVQEEATKIRSSDAWRRHLEEHPDAQLLPVDIEIHGGDDENSPRPEKPPSEDADNPYFRHRTAMGCACGEEFDVEGLGTVRAYAPAGKDDKMYSNRSNEAYR
jgi:hypothetical protein